MKQFLLLFICVILLIPALQVNSQNVSRQTDENSKMLERQKVADEKARKKIMMKLEGFFAEINKGSDGKKREELTSPLAVESIRDIEPITHTHSQKSEEGPLYAYITGTGVRMRSQANASSNVISTMIRGERIQLLAKSESTEEINGRTCPWILVQRDNGSRGWVFGDYIGKRAPRTKETDNGIKSDTGGAGSGFNLPASGTITSNFGYRVDPVTGRSGTFHSGIDISAPKGAPVKAAARGAVMQCGYFKNGYGNLVVIEHENGLCTYYGHLSAFTVTKGQEVMRGQTIGSVGATGKATGPHLHFEVRRGPRALDPDAFLR